MTTRRVTASPKTTSEDPQTPQNNTDIASTQRTGQGKGVPLHTIKQGAQLAGRQWAVGGTHGPPSAQLPPLHTNPAHPSGHPAASQQTLNKARGRRWQPCCWLTNVWEGSGLEAQAPNPLSNENSCQGKGEGGNKCEGPIPTQRQGPGPQPHCPC